MKKRKEKKVSLPGKISFVLHNIFLSLILFVSLCASILDNLFGIVSWPDDYSTVISVSSQIITGIVSLVVSIDSDAIAKPSIVISGGFIMPSHFYPPLVEPGVYVKPNSI